MNTLSHDTIRARLTKRLFWLVLACVGFSSLAVIAALHMVQNRQQQAALDRRVVKMTDIASKAARDGVPLADRLAEYAPRRPGTYLVVRNQEGALLYRDEQVPAHSLSPDIRSRTFVPAGLKFGEEVPVFEFSIDVAEDVELVRLMSAMLIALTLIAASGVRWATHFAVRRGLEPLDQLSRQLNSIEPSCLAHRLSLERPAGELQPWIERFNALLDRLELAYRQLENFNADVAHELRTPLNNLLGQTEVALSRPRSAEHLQETLSSNLEELQRLGGLVHDMLFLSRADRGAKARRGQAISLERLAQEVVDFHEAALEERGLRVTVIGGVRMAVDAGLLRRALSNLLSNAARHATERSTLEIRMEPTTGPAPGHVAMTVVNRGLDIPPDQLPRIFDRFFRADPSRQTSDLNHGLGLAIVAAIARMHGGETFAHSANGRTAIGLTIAREEAHAHAGLKLNPSDNVCAALETENDSRMAAQP